MRGETTESAAKEPVRSVQWRAVSVASAAPNSQYSTPASAVQVTVARPSPADAATLPGGSALSPPPLQAASRSPASSARAADERRNGRRRAGTERGMGGFGFGFAAGAGARRRSVGRSWNGGKKAAGSAAGAIVAAFGR